MPKRVTPPTHLVLASTMAAMWTTPALAHADEVTLDSCALPEVQAALDGAAPGDVVSIGPGDCVWSGQATWTDKSIHVRGAGTGETTIHCQQCFTITSNASTDEHSHWRLSDMTLAGNAPGGTTITIWDNHQGAHSGWRIDHMRLEYPGMASGYGILVGGPSYGLIDNNQFIWGNGMAIIVTALLDDEYPASISRPQGGYLLAQPLDLGTANALCIEDNDFTSSVPGGCAAYDTSSGGGRAVFRHNTASGCTYYSHWTRGLEIGGILHEIYANTFVGTAAFDAFPVRLEAGTGVIFDNAVIDFVESYVVFDERRGNGNLESGEGWGACDGTQAWDGNAGDPAAPGWPCLGQIGRAPGHSIEDLMNGADAASAPIYLWNNGHEPTCASGGACTDAIDVEVWGDPAYVSASPHPNGEVDYVLNGSTPMPGYVPFQYPHPLRGEDPGAADTGGGASSGGADTTSASADAGADASADATGTSTTGSGVGSGSSGLETTAATGWSDPGSDGASTGCGCASAVNGERTCWLVVLVGLARARRRLVHRDQARVLAQPAVAVARTRIPINTRTVAPDAAYSASTPGRPASVPASTPSRSAIA